jgi:hypothetical protein
MTTVIRDLASFGLTLGGGVLLGVGFVQPGWNSVVHMTAIGLASAGVVSAGRRRRMLAISVALIVAAVSAGGTLLQGADAGIFTILLVIGSAGIGGVLWRLDRTRQ